MTSAPLFIRTLANRAATAIMLGCGLISIWFLPRRLGVAAYGEYSTLIVLSSCIRFPVQTVLQSAIIPGIAGSTDPDKFASSILRLTAAAGAALTIVALSLQTEVSSILKINTPAMWYAVSCDIALNLTAAAYLSILLGKGHFSTAAAILATHWILRTGSSVIFVQSGMGSAGAMLALPVASSIQLFLCAAADKLSALRSPGVTWAEIRQRLHKSSANLQLERVIYSSDLVAMKFLGADSQVVGFYAVGSSLGLAFQAITGAANQVQVQLLVQSRKSGDITRFTALTRSAVLDTCSFIGLAILALPFLPDLLQVVLGSVYSQIHPVCLPILLTASLRTLFSCGRTFLAATESRTRIHVALLLVQITCFAGFCLTLLPGDAPEATGQIRALAQAELCAWIILAGALPISICCLRLGLAHSKQAFPWKPAGIIAVLATMAALTGWLSPFNGIKNLIFLGCLASCYAAGTVAARCLTKRYRTVCTNNGAETPDPASQTDR